MSLPNTVPQLTEQQREFFSQGYEENVRELLSFEPSSLITLYELEYSESTYRFFPGVIETEKDGKLTGYSFTKELIYNGKKYFPIPCEADGFEMSVGNKFPRPKIRISNIVNKFRSPNVDEEGFGYMSWHRFISTMMRSYNDLRDARINRRKVFLKFIDDINFDGGNPFGVPNPYAVIEDSSWVISQKLNENKFFVELELTSVFDVEQCYTPNRRFGARYCGFVYRGEGCQYAGMPKRDKSGKWFKGIDATTGVERDVVLIPRWPSEILEYDPTSHYRVGDVCFLTSPATYCINEEGGDEIKYNIGGINLDFQTVKTYYVCIRANDSSNRRDPAINPDYWSVDSCDKTQGGCCLRFGEEDYSLYNDKQVHRQLPFGAFPGVDPLTYV